MNNSVRLRKLVPPEIVFVSESGICGPEDTSVLYENGTDAVLIGETLMRSVDKKARWIGFGRGKRVRQERAAKIGTGKNQEIDCIQVQKRGQNS